MKKIALLFVLLFSLQANAGRNHLASTLERDVAQYRLPNGMTWLLVRRASSPVFFGIVQLKAGGADEEDGKSGLAHMLEHMAFKGTREISHDELWDAFVINGASNLNAYTTKDTTAYHASMPSSKLPLWLYLTSEMVKHSLLRDFDKERNVVLEELVGKMENNPFRMLDAKVLETAFKASPYKLPTIGKKGDVLNLKPEDLENFKKKYYIPSLMIGAVVGDINIEETKGLILEYFGQMPQRSLPDKKNPAESKQNETRRAEVHFDASPIMMIAYHKPTLPAPDDYVFDLITYMLCDGENSRLQKELVYKRKIARSVGCDSSTPGARLDNLFVILVEPLKGHSYKEIEDVVDSELTKFKSSEPDVHELNKVRNNVMKDFTFGLASNEGLATSLAYFQAIAGDWRYVIKHASIINDIKGDDIVNTAKKYFADENKTIVTLDK